MTDGVSNASPWRCHLCGSEKLDLAPAYPNFKRVTSDCKPWRAGGNLARCSVCGLVQTVVNNTWHQECNEIYRQYTIYHQSCGVEQSVFVQGDGKSSLRSDRIVECLLQQNSFPQTGRALDLGCGNGAFLRAFSKQAPQWKLYGSEFDAKNIESLRSIPGFVELFTGDWKQIPGKFQLVSLIHVLEHIPSPFGVLEMLHSKLDDDGLLLIEVPDCSQNPYMLLVADHCSHFSVGALREIVTAAGYDVIHAGNDWVTKEISVLARKPRTARASGSPSIPAAETAPILRGVDLLSDLLRRVEPMARAGRFGIFGASIAATWLHAQLNDAAEFFVDEDPSRAGKQHLGKPILPPSLIPRDTTVFVALPQPMAGKVADRIRRPGIRVETP